MSTYVFGLVIGVITGIASGLFGIGGGIIIVPALVYFLGYDQHKAQGTSMVTLLLPVGLLSVVNYWKAHHIDLKVGAVAAVGLFCGAFFGSKIALSFDPVLMRKVFSVFLAVVAVYTFFKK